MQGRAEEAGGEQGNLIISVLPSFFRLANTYLVSIHYVLSPDLGAGDTAANKTARDPSPEEFTASGQEGTEEMWGGSGVSGARAGLPNLRNSPIRSLEVVRLSPSQLGSALANGAYPTPNCEETQQTPETDDYFWGKRLVSCPSCPVYCSRKCLLQRRQPNFSHLGIQMHWRK